MMSNTGIQKSFILIIIIFMSVFMAGCIEPPVSSCESDDVCAMFDCMVASCWCDDSSPESPVLYETYITVQDKQGAIDAVNAYLAMLKFEKGQEDLKVIRAGQLNDKFHNVFVEDSQGNEFVYTVAANGTIIKTICGV